MPVTLRANCIGSLAARELASDDSRIAGQVVNTFANSFYLKTVSSELVFVTNRPLQSPISINLDSTSNWDQLVKTMDTVQARPNEILVGSEVRIDLSATTYYEDESILSKGLSPRFSEIEDAIRVVVFILRIIDTSQSVLDEHGLTHKGVVRFLCDGVLPLLRSHAEERFREAAFDIIGLGSGFTPSGDDALGGFLATYNSLAHTVRFPPILLDFASLQQKTSWISAKLLDYMQRQILDNQMRHVIDSAATGNGDSVVLAFEAILPRGHASGIDISVGTLLALSLIRDIALEKEETRTTIGSLGLSFEVA